MNAFYIQQALKFLKLSQNLLANLHDTKMMFTTLNVFMILKITVCTKAFKKLRHLWSCRLWCLVIYKDGQHYFCLFTIQNHDLSLDLIIKLHLECCEMIAESSNDGRITDQKNHCSWGYRRTGKSHCTFYFIVPDIFNRKKDNGNSVMNCRDTLLFNPSDSQLFHKN